MAENFENYFTKFQKVTRNRLDIFDKHFLRNSEKYFEKILKIIPKIFEKYPRKLQEIFFRKNGEFREII